MLLKSTLIMIRAAATMLDHAGLLLITVDSNGVSWLAALSLLCEQIARYSCIWDPRPAQQCVMSALEVIVQLPQRPDGFSWGLLSWCYTSGAMLFWSKEAGLVVRGTAFVPRFAVLAIAVLMSAIRKRSQMQWGFLSWCCALLMVVLIMRDAAPNMLHSQSGELVSSASFARIMRRVAVIHEIYFVACRRKPTPSLTMAWLMSLQLSATVSVVGILVENGCTFGACPEIGSEEVWIWVDFWILCVAAFACWKCRQKWCLIVMLAAVTALMVLPATTANWLSEFEALTNAPGLTYLLRETDFISVALVAFGGGLQGCLALFVAIQSAITIQRIAHGV